MSTVVGLALVVLGMIVILSGVALVISEIVTGKHRRGRSRAEQMQGETWVSAIEGIVKGFAAIFKALSDWPQPALIILLGIALICLGLYVALATRL